MYNNNIDIKNLYKSWNTVLDLLNDRRYNTPEKYIITLEEFTVLYNNDNINIYIPPMVLPDDEIEVETKEEKNEKNDKDKLDEKNKNYGGKRVNGIYVDFSTSQKSLGKAIFKTKITEIFEKYTSEVHVILVLKNKINNIIIKELDKDKNSNVETFIENKLYYNITKHYLVSQHIPISKKEANLVLLKYNATKKQIPKILITDPVARYYGMRLGDMCKIIRKNKYIGSIISYRIVINRDSV